MNTKLIQSLNVQLANWNVLYTKLHNYHWYVTGNDFFTLHEKFEELYTEAATNIDDIAERILAIKGQPVATLKDYLETATLKEANGSEDAKEMVQSIVRDFEQLIQESAQLIEQAEEAKDDATADMFIAYKASMEKHKWMFEAYLK